jgi:hypothetical protein
MIISHDRHVHIDSAILTESRVVASAWLWADGKILAHVYAADDKIIEFIKAASELAVLVLESDADTALAAETDFIAVWR